MAIGQILEGTTRPLLNTDGSGGHRPEVVGVNPSDRTGTLLAASVRTADSASSDQTNDHGRGLTVWINVSAVAGAASVTLKIQRKDPASGVYSDILASAAISATGLTVLRVYPGIAAAANAAASDILPRTWRVYVTHGNADQITYSVAASVSH